MIIQKGVGAHFTTPYSIMWLTNVKTVVMFLAVLIAVSVGRSTGSEETQETPSDMEVDAAGEMREGKRGPVRVGGRSAETRIDAEPIDVTKPGALKSWLNWGTGEGDGEGGEGGEGVQGRDGDKEENKAGGLEVSKNDRNARTLIVANNE